MNFGRFTSIAVLIGALICLAALPIHAQGIRNAFDYAYGNAGAKYGALLIDTGNTAAGAQTITLQFGSLPVMPPNTTAITTTTPLIVGTGATADSVTPSAVSCTTPAKYATCTFTATFTYTHGRGERVRSGTCGLVEAVNAAHATGGGVVIVDSRFTALGCTTSTITSNKGYTDVTVLNYLGTTGAKSYTSSSNGVNMTVTAVTLY